MACTQEVLLKRAVLYQEGSQLEEGHYREDTPKSILEEGANLQPASKVGGSGALRFDQMSRQVRQSEHRERKLT